MGKLLVKLIGSSIDLASEAISSARNRPSTYPSDYKITPSRDLTMDQSGEFVFAEDKTAGALVSGGYAGVPVSTESHIQTQYIELPAGSESLLFGHYAELPAGNETLLHNDADLPVVPPKLHPDLSVNYETIPRNDTQLPVVPAKLQPEIPTGNETLLHNDTAPASVSEKQHYNPPVDYEALPRENTDRSIVPTRLHPKVPSSDETLPRFNTYLPLVSQKKYTEYTEGAYPALDKSLSQAPMVERDRHAYSESNYSVDLDREIDETEAIWQLDETAHDDLPPNYEESEFLPSVAYANELNQAQEAEDMIRELVQMAGLVQSTQRIPCPIVIPQRRPGSKSRGFVRAYAPILANFGISSDLFSEFLEDFYQASKTSGWLEVVSIAADIGDHEKAAQVTNLLLQVVAGTMQSRNHEITFLDRVNQQIFIPRGLYAMVVQFKDQAPSQDQGRLSLLSQKPGKTLFAVEMVESNQPGIQIHNEPGHPHSQIELPEVAQLEFPDLDLEANCTESSLAIPQSARTNLTLLHQHQGHFCKNGKLISRLTAGKLGTKPGLIERAATAIKTSENTNTKRMSELTGGKLGHKSSLIEQAATSFLEHKNAKRISDCQSRCGKKKQRQKHQGMKAPRPDVPATKGLQRNLQYLVIVNISTQEEMQQYLSQLEFLMQQIGPHEVRSHRS